jgi:protocatechuate 3,4-dioxygenase beta subunit
MAPILPLVFLGALVAPYALGHPGHDIREEAAERRAFLKRSPSTVRSCKPELERQGHQSASLERRQLMAHETRVKKGLTDHPLGKRDFRQYLDLSHNSTSGVSLGVDERLLFDDNSTCVLQPEITQGPYYVDGELIRSNITEDQAGIPLYLDIQLIDTSTCLPVPAVLMDIWHCNSTGVYSGVHAAGNGEADDVSNIDANFLRGIQQTDVNGVAQFTTIFPGHYTGRATHIHVLTHNPNDTTVRTNATLSSGNFTAHASHSGQIFFDQDLISDVENNSPYNTNTQAYTSNAVDYLLFEEAESMDPIVEYVLLGDKITDGIMAWISLGIDPTIDNEITAAAAVYKSDGEMNPTAPDDLGFATDEEKELRSSLEANAPTSTSTR